MTAHPAPKPFGGVRRLPRVLSPTEAKRLLSAARGTRDKAVIATGLYAGLRRNEIRMLDAQDIDLDQQLIHVWQGKGGRDSTLPLNPLLVPYLTPLIAGVPGAAPVFMSARHRRVSERLLNVIVEKAARAAGLRGVHPHTLRHTYGTELQRRGGDLAKTQRLMRHAQISTTMIYVHLAVEDVRKLANELDFEGPGA